MSPLQPAAATRTVRADWFSVIRTLFLAGGAQAVIQLIALLTGLAVVQLLPIQEYAYYTIINAVLGTLSVLTDGGASHNVLSQGGQVWKDREALGGVVAGGLKLRRRFALIAAVISIPIAWVLLRKQGASAGVTALLIASATPVFLASFTSQLLEIVPRLHQRLWPLQKIQILGNGLRFVAVVGAAAALPVAWVANLATALTQIWSAWRIRSLAQPLADWRRPPDPDAWQRMVGYVRRALPAAIYFALYGQVTVWLISLFGNAESVAQVGALGRLAMVLNVLVSVFALVVLPRFARLPDRSGAASILGRFWQLQGLYALTLALIVSGVALFPQAALRVLGSEYQELTHEVVLMAAGSALWVLAGAAQMMAAARGVAIAPAMLIGCSVLGQGVLVLTLPMNTLSGVLWLGMLSNGLLWILHAANFTVARAKGE